MAIKDLNQKFIERYLRIPLDLRVQSSYPFLIDFEVNRDTSNVPIYFKQPQDWLSSQYGNELDSQMLHKLLMNEYNNNLLVNTNYKPIKYFLLFRDKIYNENRSINLIYNNIVKFSRRSNPDSYDGELMDLFNDLIEEEYKAIKPTRAVFCIGPEEDYWGMMSWKMLNDIDIKPLTKEKPYNIYLDLLGNEVLHTYHPGYWFEADENLEDLVYRFIIGGSKNI